MKIGSKVVCVDDSPCFCGCGRPQNVIKGQTYVIESIADYGQGIRLILIGNPALYPHPERGINPRRFRPLDELKQEAKQRQQKEQTAANPR